ncbi:hypothetical protein [Pedobacter frigoris]|uniref:hypothetical protein n=1 Tax=Pedobacter frigoris TaxID=2571272 RepID=UPI0029306D35|nr:hypothetical protein [Pedobacter frigoris]
MKAELINEFYLLQQSRVANKYNEVLEEQVYAPLKHANHKMTTWISERGLMLMSLDVRLYNSMKHLRKKYLKF